MNGRYDVAVVGASGMIGEAMMSILEERKFPIRNIYPLGSERSAGTTLQFNGESVEIGLLSEFDFSRVQYGLFSAGASVSDVYAPKQQSKDAQSSTIPRGFVMTPKFH